MRLTRRVLATTLLAIAALVAAASAPALGRTTGAAATLGLSVSTTTPAPGQTITAVGTGCVTEVGRVAGLSLLQDGRFIDGGIVPTEADGSFSTSLAIPDDTPPGTVLVVYAVCGDGDVVAADAELTLVVTAPPTTEVTTTSSTAAAAADAVARPTFTG